MQIFRLAYIAVFLLSLMAVFTLWSQVGGQGHLDLVPWSVKLALGASAAYSITRASAAAVKGEHGWNSQSVKWTGLALATLFLCGMASFYAHNNLEDTGDEQDQGDATVSSAYHDCNQENIETRVTLERYAQVGIRFLAGGHSTSV
jgi:hypothetical protein